MQATGTVLDRLILVNSESVWFVHEGEVTDAEEKRLLQAEREITLLLITYRSPLAATRLPRIINADSAMQAAAPAAETARLFELLAPRYWVGWRRRREACHCLPGYSCRKN